MAIGKPLNVDQRLGVEQPVLSPQTQALSSNVAAQKIQFADYSIGMNNAKASFAVSEELVKMVDAGVKAKMYIDNTKQDYQRLNLMEEWQKSDMDYKAQFAQALTPEAQEAVIADYDSSLQKRTGDWRKSMGNDVESQKYLSSLRSGSQKQFSTFSTTHSQTLFKRTSGLHANTIERVAKALSEDKNADVVSGFKTIQDTTASLVGMGAIEPEIAQFNLSNLKDKIVTGRSALFAQDFAKNATTTGHYPTDKEFKAQMEGVMGMELGERRLKLLQESFEDSYFKEIGERNRQVKAEETYALEVTEAGRLDLQDRVNKAIQDKTIAPELKEKLIKEAHTFDYAVKGFGASIEKKIRESEYGTSYKPFVEHFTSGDGRKFILENIKADGTSYFNLDELRGHLETMGGKYEGMNESTIREVLTHWRGINDSTRKGLADQGEEVMQVALMSMLKTDQAQVPEWLQAGTMKQLGVASSMLTQMKDPMHLNWSKTMRYSPAHAKAWNVTLSDIKAQFDSKQGVFSKENISQPADVQRSMLENYVGKLLEKNFSESVNEELARLDNEKLKKREKLETEQRNKKAQAEKEKARIGKQLQTGEVQDSTSTPFAMEKIGDGISLDKPASKEVPPAVKLIEHQMSKKRIRNAQYASTFKDQLNKGEFGSAVGTAVASKWTDITQAIRDAHEQSKQTYNKSSLNDRSQHLKDMAVITKEAKKAVASGIWGKLAKAVGQGESITIEGLSNDLGMLAGTVGDLLIDGVENHNIEKTPITNTKRTTVKTPDPLATPPKTQPAESPNIAKDIVENPIIKNIVGTVNDLMGGVSTTGEAASTFQDPNFDPAAPTGVRAFTGPASKDLAVKPEGAKGATGEYPQYGEQYAGGTSEESDIEGFVEDTVDMPPVVMDEIVVSEQANKLKGSTAEDLFDAQLKSDTSTPEVLQSRVGEAIQKIPRGSKNPQQIAQASMSIMPVLKLLAPVQTNVLTGYLTKDAPAHHMIGYGGRGAFYSAQNELGLLSPERKQNLTELEDFVTNNAQRAFGKELSKIRTRLGMSVGDLTEHMKLIYMAETNVGTNVKDSTPTKPGDRPAIGNLQVMATTFKDLIGKQFGENAAIQAGLDYTELSKLKANNDLDGLEVLLRNKNVNFIAGMAKMIQYLEVKANKKKTKKKSKSVKGK